MRGNVFYLVPPYCSKLYCLNMYMAMYSDERGKEAVLFYRYEDSTMTEKCFFLCLFLRLLYIREHRQLGLLLKACNYWHLKFTLQLPPRNRPISSAHLLLETWTLPSVAKLWSGCSWCSTRARLLQSRAKVKIRLTFIPSESQACVPYILLKILCTSK